MSVSEDAVTLEELRKADELFLTGTTVEIWPVSHLDGLKVGGQAPGELTCQLMKAFNERVSGKVDA
jgi:D-alanine transaminase